MRETCLYCVSKHIAQSIVLVTEACQGYPMHIWVAIGHLAEAETESCSEFPKLSNDIRKVRLALMGQEGTFNHCDLMELLNSARMVAEKVNLVSELSRIEEIIYKGQCQKELEEIKISEVKIEVNDSPKDESYLNLLINNINHSIREMKNMGVNIVDKSDEGICIEHIRESPALKKVIVEFEKVREG